MAPEKPVASADANGSDEADLAKVRTIPSLMPSGHRIDIFRLSKS